MRRNGSRIMREELMLSREHGTHLCMQEENKLSSPPQQPKGLLSI
jgi:hypothetical protein